MIRHSEPRLARRRISFGREILRYLLKNTHGLIQEHPDARAQRARLSGPGVRKVAVPRAVAVAERCVRGVSAIRVKTALHFREPAVFFIFPERVPAGLHDIAESQHAGLPEQ